MRRPSQNGNTSLEEDDRPPNVSTLREDDYPQSPTSFAIFGTGKMSVMVNSSSLPQISTGDFISSSISPS